MLISSLMPGNRTPPKNMDTIEYIGARLLFGIIIIVAFVIIMIASWKVQSKVTFLRNKPRLVFGIIFFGILFLIAYSQGEFD